MKSNVSRYWLDEVPVDEVNGDPTRRIIGLAARKKPAMVCYLNPYVFTQIKHNKFLGTVFNNAALVYPDGWGIILALRFLGVKITRRATTVDFFDHFCYEARKSGLTLAFVGGKKQMGKEALKVLRQRYPGLKFFWVAQGFFNERQEKKIMQRLQQLEPDFLLIGLGTPWQELWMQKVLKPSRARVLWSVGSLMEYYTGRPLAPRFLGKWGFEWLFRLIVEPKRLWKRYTWENLCFFGHLLKLKLKRR